MSENTRGLVTSVTVVLLVWCSYAGCRSGRKIEAFPGKYSGVGMELETDGNKTVVLGTIKGSPASEAGVKKGDVLLEIDGEPVKAMSLAEIVDRIRGPSGTLVRLTLEGKTGKRVLSLKRGSLKRTDYRNRSKDGYIVGEALDKKGSAK